MSASHPRDTLSYQMGRPLLRMQSIASRPCSEIAAKLKAYVDSDPGLVHPETEALMFYQLNHAVALIAKRRHKFEPLPKAELELVEKYFSWAGKASLRVLYYLLIITSRESRHLKNASVVRPKLASEFGPGAASFFNEQFPDSSSSAVSYWISEPPLCTFGAFTGALARQFYTGKYSASFGGKAWGQVADCLDAFVTGKYSLAMMMDTVWTLCHNNGPIFNKGHFYHCYGHLTTFYTILDVQRAGLIPTFLLHPLCGSEFVNKEIIIDNTKIHALFPDLPKVVDWEQVEALGAKQTYTKFKPGFKPTAKAGFKKASTVVYKSVLAESWDVNAAMKVAKAIADKAYFHVYPGFAVPILDLKRTP